MQGARGRPYVDMVKEGNAAADRPGRNPEGRGDLGASLCREPLQYRHIVSGSPPRPASHIASVAHVPIYEIGSGLAERCLRKKIPATGRPALVALFVLMCAGCSYLPNTISGSDFLKTNYLSYEHAFTDAAAADVRKTAERECSYRKQVAVRTGGNCSLTRCTTNFQCLDKADATKYQTQSETK